MDERSQWVFVVNLIGRKRKDNNNNGIQGVFVVVLNGKESEGLPSLG